MGPSRGRESRVRGVRCTRLTIGIRRCVYTRPGPTFDVGLGRAMPPTTFGVVIECEEMRRDLLLSLEIHTMYETKSARVRLSTSWVHYHVGAFFLVLQGGRRQAILFCVASKRFYFLPLSFFWCCFSDSSTEYMVQKVDGGTQATRSDRKS